MFQSEAEQSRRRHYRVIRACNGCRRRRGKCDGVQPVCGACSSSGHECSWSPDNDDARPATKQYVESLRVKIRILESEIKQLKQASPQPPEPSGSSNAQSGPGLPSNDIQESPISEFPITLHAGTSPSVSTDHPLPYLHHNKDVPLIPATPQSGASFLPLSPYYPETPVPLRLIQSPSIVPAPPILPGLTYQYIFDIDTSIPFEQQKLSAQASLTCQWNRYLPDLGPFQLSRVEHDTILSRCFSHGPSWLTGLISDLFLRDMVDQLRSESLQSPPPAHHYTPMLHCSLLAFGAAFSDDPSIRMLTTRQRFAAHAKKWLDEDLSRWTPSLVLSLSLLSEYHCGIGERNTGYMYMGMSIRMAGARTDTPVLGPAARDWYHWSTFVREKLLALDSKGPSKMHIPKAPISLDLPIPVDLGGRPRMAISTASLVGDEEYSKFVIEGFIQNCKLIVIAATRMIDQRVHTNSTVIDVHVQLETWVNALPDGLLIRQRSSFIPPHVLSLHVCYWWLILYLHLPLLESVHKTISEPVNDLSVKMCERATEKLVQLFSAFEKQFGFRCFPSNLLKAIYTCGWALLLELAMVPGGSGAFKRRTTAQEGLNMCIHALHTIGSTWPSARLLVEDLEAKTGTTTRPSPTEASPAADHNRRSGGLHIY